MVRPLPVCVAPFVDESVDSWIERIAREYRYSRPKLLCAAGIRDRLTMRTFPRDPVRARELPAIAGLTHRPVAELRKRAALCPASWTVRAKNDFIFCLHCTLEDTLEDRPRYERARWYSAVRIGCPIHRHWLWSARARFGCGHIDRLRKERGEIPTAVWFQHFQAECRALDRIEEREPEVVEALREFEKVIDAALRGASPPEDQWGRVEPVDFLHVVRDVTSWAVTNFEPFRSQPVATQFTGQQSLGNLREFRWPYRGNPPWDYRVGATPINHVFNPSMRRAALWTAHGLLARQHPRRPHQGRALSLRERRRRIFRYQNGESLNWLVAQARHWPGEYVRYHWNRLAEVRERLG
jgi:hypothetical protein